MSELSAQDFTVPSAVLWDGGLLLIPLFAVTEISLTETYHLPTIGSTGARAIAPVHDSSIRLNGLLVGPGRYGFKLMLENQAEAAQRGSAAAKITGGAIGGLILVTAMTIRTDMQVKELTFSENATRRQTLSLGISLEHLPRPTAIGKLLDIASVGVGALMDATA
ncbi:MAG: hypothetical protein WCY11_13075 [Novosphingobium sp.]